MKINRQLLAEISRHGKHFPQIISDVYGIDWEEEITAVSINDTFTERLLNKIIDDMTSINGKPHRENYTIVCITHFKESTAPKHDWIKTLILLQLKRYCRPAGKLTAR